MFTDPLNITAIRESTLGPSKLNVEQSIPIGSGYLLPECNSFPIPVYLKKMIFGFMS